MTAQQYPLAWPESWHRTTSPAKSQFKTSLTAAIDNVQGSLKRFAADSGKKVENVLVSSNVSLMERSPKDAGVAVYFTWDGISTCIAVDRYQKIEENLQGHPPRHRGRADETASWRSKPCTSGVQGICRTAAAERPEV